MKLTVDDLVNPRRKSGYDHVQSHGGSVDVEKRRWRAISYKGDMDKSGRHWYGPSRVDAREAAQDYCDHKNAQPPKASVQGYIYLLTEEISDGKMPYAKIGYSLDPESRLNKLQTGNPRKLKLLYKMPGTEEQERRLHYKYKREKIMLEWFRFNPAMILEFPEDAAV